MALSPAARLARSNTRDESGKHTLFYQSSLLRNRQDRYAAWSNSITVWRDKFVNAVPVKQFIDKQTDVGLAIFESEDGVHWHETERFTCPLRYACFGFCMRWTGKDFIYYNSEINQGPNRKEHPVILRQYRSHDLKSWTFMGDEFSTWDDRRWYLSRWDELVVLEDSDACYGYITSEPRPELAKDSMGMLKSSDGERWQVLPPPAFEWEGLPSQQMEVCFCEKIKERYYLGMGARCYLGHLGFSVMTFVSDSPLGPFRPDKEAFRLTGSTTRDVNWLAKTFHYKDEILLSNWITTSMDRSFFSIFANGQSHWIGPLKKLVTDAEDHLRIVYWPGNEAAKGKELPASLEKLEFVHPAEAYRQTKLTASGDTIAMTAPAVGELVWQVGQDGGLAMFPESFDFTRGFVIEGALKATEPRGRIGTHWHAAAAGFYFEETLGKGMLVQCETLGLTRIGLFEYSAEPAFDADEFKLAAFGNIARGGPYLRLSRFSQEDVIGPQGYASPCGIFNSTSHTFRLLVQNGMWEFYLDDRYVQTFITGPTSGRLGLFAKSGIVVFSELRIWEMV